MYTKVAHDVQKASSRQAQASMEQARHEVLQHYSLEVSEGEVPDILVSCDGTWQKRGFTSLYGACFVIAHETGKVVDYAVMSKYCVGCHRWDGKDKTSEDYLRWKAGHVCNVDYEGSSGGMEPHGTLKMFQRSLDFHLRYRYLISDGDSKSHNLILKSQPYGSSYMVEKKDCIGHIQKRMGAALRELVSRHRGEKLSDGMTIGGTGHLTAMLMNSLQNYYGDVIRKNAGDLDGMMKGVHATLLHCNSTDATPHHNLEKIHGVSTRLPW